MNFDHTEPSSSDSASGFNKREIEPKPLRERHPLAALYPHYTETELNEAYENLRRYVELGWKIAVRLDHEGRLETVLTKAGFNPTVNPPIDP